MPDTPSRPNPSRFLPKTVERTPGGWGRGHLKVDNMLKDEDRDAYLALLRQPGTTGRKAWQWLRDKGYKVGPGAVKHHRRRFNDQLREVRTSAEMSLVCADLVRQVGVNRMSDAAVLRFEALLTQALFHKYQSGDALEPKEWESLGRALTAAVNNRTKVEKTRIEGEEAKRETERHTKPVKSRPIDGNALSDKVRRMLGMPLPGEPTPALPPPPGSAEPRTTDPETPSPPPSPGGRGSEHFGSPSAPGTPTPHLPLPPGEGRGEGA